MAPKITASRTDRELSVSQRRPIRMECDVTGVPPPEVTWTKDGAAVSDGRGRRLLEGGRVLQLAAALVKDSGVYVCTAKNVAGVGRKQFNLHVLGITRFSTSSAAR